MAEYVALGFTIVIALIGTLKDNRNDSGTLSRRGQVLILLTLLGGTATVVGMIRSSLEASEMQTKLTVAIRTIDEIRERVKTPEDEEAEQALQKLLESEPVTPEQLGKAIENAFRLLPNDHAESNAPAKPQGD